MVSNNQSKSIFKDKQLLILAVMSVVMVIVVLGPVLTQLKTRLSSKKKLAEQLGQLNEKLTSLSGIEPVLIDERVKKMEAVFPSQKPIVQLMSTLSKLSEQNNLIFGGVSLQPGSLEEEAAKTKKGKTSTDLRDLRFGFQVGGDFDDILNFMKGLENVAPLMKIEKIGLSIKTNPLLSVKTTLVVADVQVAAFYQPPPKTLGSISSPVKLLSRQEEALLNKLTSFKTFETVVPVGQTGKQNLFE